MAWIVFVVAVIFLWLVFLILIYVFIKGTSNLLLRIPIIAKWVNSFTKKDKSQSDNEYYGVQFPNIIPSYFDKNRSGFKEFIYNCLAFWCPFQINRQNKLLNKFEKQRDARCNTSTFNCAPEVIHQQLSGFPYHFKRIIKRLKGNINKKQIEPLNSTPRPTSRWPDTLIKVIHPQPQSNSDCPIYPRLRKIENLSNRM